MALGDMTPEEQQALIAWLVGQYETMDLTSVIPGDDLNPDALLWNLVQWLSHGTGFDRYEYRPEQDRAIDTWLNRQEET